MDGSHHVWHDAGDKRRRRSADPQRLSGRTGRGLRPRRHGSEDPRVSPLYSDLGGFPPTLIQVGAAETLLADATRFAAAAGAADVAVTLEIWPHMIHAWPMWNARLADGR